jgi:hypothetical protein
MKSMRRVALTATALAIPFIAAITVHAIAGGFEQQPFLPAIIISSTIPGNGDLNPYGVAIVPRGFPSGGTIAPGDVLVSNFNNSANAQGTGTTIIKLTPNGLVAPPPTMPGGPGNATTFFPGATGLGLTTALGSLGAGSCWSATFRPRVARSCRRDRCCFSTATAIKSVRTQTNSTALGT